MSFPARTPRFLLGALVILALAVPDGARAARNRWTPISPPGAFGVTRVHFDPHDPTTVYSETGASGLWRSRNGGATWTLIGEHLPARPGAFAVDPAGVLYATLDLARYTASFWKSEDQGETWSQVFDFGPDSMAPSRLVTDPGKPGDVFWLLQDAAFRSTNEGRSFSCLDPCSSSVTAAAFDPEDPATIYTASVASFSRSTDGGATWTRSVIEPYVPVLGAVVTRLAPTSDPDVLYAWNDDPLPANPAPCFARSDDAGQTWKGILQGQHCSEPLVDPDEPLTVRMIVGDTAPRLWTSHDGGDTWTRGPAVPAKGALTAHPSDTGVLFLATAADLFKSRDGGATWLSSSQGLRASTATLLVPSPHERGVLYAGIGSAGSAGPGLSWFLQKSTDAGHSWTKLPLRAPTALVIDPAAPRHLYAAALLMPDGSLATSRIVESQDGGRSWKEVSKNLPLLTPYLSFVQVNRLVVDARNPRVLYAGTSGSGFLKSTDRGRTWHGSNRGLPFLLECESRFCPANSVVEIVQDPAAPRTLYIVFDGEIFRSADGGATWVFATDGIPKFSVLTIAADPARPEVLFAAGGILGSPYSSPGSVYRSGDGGRTWSATAELPEAPVGYYADLQSAAVRDLAVTPAGVFVATVGRGVIRSADQGLSWTEVSQGLPDLLSPSILEPDPTFPGRLFLGTWSYGLFTARFVP